MESLNSEDLQALSAEIPTSNPCNIIDVLVNAGVASSNGEARRLISGGAVSVNGNKLTTEVDVAPVSLVKKGKNILDNR